MQKAIKHIKRAINWQIIVICVLLGLGCSYFSNLVYDTAQNYKPTLSTLEQIRDVLNDWKREDLAK